MVTQVKICGIKTPDAMTAALEGGADFVGLVFHPASPRYVDIEVASYLAQYVPDSVKVVGLFVDTDPALLETILSNVRIDMMQLHGNETPDLCASLRETYKRPVMKALSASDLPLARTYEEVCDWMMIDTPAPPGAVHAGGSGQTFDWAIVHGYHFTRPWMLAGGLTADNVANAIRQTRPTAVDVSSGVEISRGVKDPAKIRAFLEAVKAV
jgi:phosphoribosylanthranilate isomerase